MRMHNDYGKNWNDYRLSKKFNRLWRLREILSTMGKLHRKKFPAAEKMSQKNAEKTIRCPNYVKYFTNGGKNKIRS